jgi:hypothetical protein
MKRFFALKYMAVAVLFSVAGGAWGSTYQWTYGGSTYNWNDQTNWNSGAGGYPGDGGDLSGDTATFDSGSTGSITISNIPISGTYINDVTINESTASITLGGDLSITGNLNITTGILNADGKNISIGGDWTNTGTFTSGGGTQTVIFNGIGAQSIVSGGTSFNALTVNKTAGTLTANTNVETAAGFSITAGEFAHDSSTVAVNGDFSQSAGTFTQGSGTITLKGPANIFGGTFLKSASGLIKFNAGAAQSLSASGKDLGNVTVSDALTILTIANQTVTFDNLITTASGTLSLDGTGGSAIIKLNSLSNQGSLQIANSGTNAAAIQAASGTANFTNKDVSWSSGQILALSGILYAPALDLGATTATVRLDNSTNTFTSVTVGSGTFDANGNSWSQSGSWDNSASGSLANATGTTTFTGGNATLTSGGAGAGKTFGAITLNKASSVNFLALSGALGCGQITLTTGILNAAANDITAAGFSDTSGNASFTPSAGETVTLTGGNAVGTEFANLAITGSVTMTGAVTASGSTAFSGAGSLAMGGNTLGAAAVTRAADAGTGTFLSATAASIVNTSAVTIEGSAGTINLSNIAFNLTGGTWNDTGFSGGWTSPASLRTIGSTTLTSSHTQDSVTIGDGLTTTATSLGNDLTMSGTLTISTSATLDTTAANRAISTTSWTNNGAYTGNASAVTFTNTGSISGSAETTFNRVAFNGTNTTASTAFSVTNGLSIGASGRLSTSGAITVSVGGDWTNARGTAGFTAGSSIVEFTGTGTHNISGATNFYDLKNVAAGSTLEFTASQIFGITHTLNVQGTSGNPVKIQSSTAALCTLNNSGAQAVSFVQVSHCAAGAAGISATNSIDSTGDNTNWSFGTITWLGGTPGFETSTNTGSNWTSGIVPGANETVSIPASVTAPDQPVQDAALSLKALILADTTSAWSNGGRNLTISATGVTNSGTFTYTGTGALTLNTASFSGTFVYSGGTAGMIPGITAYNNLTVSGGSITAVAATVTGTTSITGGTLSIPAATTLAAGTFSNTAGTLNLVGNGSILSCSSFAVSGSGSVTNAATGTGITCSGNVALSGTGSFSNPAYNTVTMTGITAPTIDSSMTLGNLNINTTGTVSVSTNNLALAGNLVLTQGTFSDAGLTVSVAGNITRNTTGIISATGTLEFNSTGAAQTANLSGSTIANIEVNNTHSTPTVTLTNTSSFTWNGNCTLTAGTLIFPAVSQTIGGSVTGSGTADLSGFGAGNTLSVGGNWSATNLTPGANSTVAFTGASGAGPFTITSNGQTFRNLTVNAASKTVELGDALTVAGNLAITGGTLDVTTSNRAITLGGNFTLTAPGALNARSGTFTFNGTGTQTASSATFYAVVGSKTAGAIQFTTPAMTSFATDAPPANKAFAVSLLSGGSIANAVTFDNTGAAGLTIGGGFTFSNGATATVPTKSIAGAITATTGNLDFGSASTTLTGNTTLTASGGTGYVRLADVSGTGYTLDVTGGTGATAITGDIGAAGARLLSATFSSAGTLAVGSIYTSRGQSYTAATSTTLNGATYSSNDGEASSGYGISFTGPVLLGADVTISTTGTNAADDITFSASSTVNNAHTLALNAGANGDISLGTAVGASTALTGVTLTANTANLPAVTTSGAQNYSAVTTTTLNDTLTVNTAGAGVSAKSVSIATGGGTITLTGTDSANDISFTGAVNAAAAGSQGLTLTAGGGDISFSLPVGATNALSGVTVTSVTPPNTVGFSDTVRTDSGGINVTATTTTIAKNVSTNYGATAGAFSVTGALTATAALTITTNSATTDANVSVTGAVTATAGTLIIDAGTGNVSMSSATNNFGTLAITNAYDATIRDANGIDLGTSTIGNDLTVTAGDSITDSGTLGVTNLASFATRKNDGSATIVLNTAANNYGSLSLQTLDSLGTSTVAGQILVTETSSTDLALVNSSDASSGITVTSTGAVTDSGVITAKKLIVNSVGGATLDWTNAIQSIQVTNATSGSVTVNNAAPTALAVSGITTPGAGNITLTADDLDVTGTVQTASGIITLQPASPGTIIDIGDSASGVHFNLSAAELAYMTAATGTLRIGNATNTGGILVSAPVTIPNVPTVRIQTATGIAKTVTVTAIGTAATTNLALVAVTGIDVETAASSLAASNSTSNGITISNARGAGSNVNITTVDSTIGITASGQNIAITETSGGIALAQNISTGTTTGSITLRTAQTASQTTGSITTPNLLLLGAGAKTLTSTSNSVGTLAANITGSGAALSYTDADAFTVGSVSGTDGITTNGGNVTLDTASGGDISIGLDNAITTGGATITFSDPVLLAASTTISTGAGIAGNIVFSSTLRGTTADTETLTLVAGTGSVQFNGMVGATRLGTLTVSSADGGISSGAGITIDAASINLTGGPVDLNGAVTAPGGFSSSGTTFDNTGATITTTGTAISITHSGNVTIGAGISSGAGTTTVTTTGGNVTFTTTGANAITTTSGNITVQATGNIATTIAADNFSELNTSSGTIYLDASNTGSTIGTSTGTPLQIASTAAEVNIEKLPPSGATAPGGVWIQGVGGALTLGTVNVTGALYVDIYSGGKIYLTRNVTTAGSNITYNQPTFLRPVASPIAITTSGGNVSFASTLAEDDAVAVLAGTNSLSIDTTGVSGTGNISFTGAVGASKAFNSLTATVKGNLNFSSSAKVTNAISIPAAQNVTFTGTVDAASLKQDAGAAGCITRLGDNVTTTGAAGVDITNETINLDGLSIDAGTGTGQVDLHGNVTLTSGAASLKGQNIRFYGTVSGAQNLTLETAAATPASIVFDSAVGSPTQLGAITVTDGFDVNIKSSVSSSGLVSITHSGLLTISDTTNDSDTSTYDIIATGGFSESGTDGTVDIAGDIQTTSTAISFVNTIHEIGNVALTTGAGAGNITLSGGVSRDTTVRTLDLTAGTGSIIVPAGQSIGVSGTELGSVTIHSATNVAGNAGATANLAPIYAASLTQSAGAGTSCFGLILTSGNISISSATITCNGTVESTAGTLYANGTANINTTSMKSSGTQTYTGAVTLGADASFTGSTVTFQSTVSGAASHSIGITGNAVFGDAIGDTVTSLTSLDVSGTTDLYTNTVSASGAQTWGDIVTLHTGVNFTGGSGSLVWFKNKLGGGTTGYAVTVTNADARFDNTVGEAGRLVTSLQVTAGTAAINTTGITTSAAQSYGGNITLGANPTLTGTNITFNGTVSGALRTLKIVNSGCFLAAASGSITVDTFTQTGTHECQLATGITADTGISFASNVYLYRNAPAPADSSMTFNSPVIQFGADLFIAANDGGNKTVVFNRAGPASVTVNVGGSCVLFAGEVQFGTYCAGISATNDLVLLNGNPATMNDYSGVPGLFGYNYSGRSGKTAAASLTPLPASYPATSPTFPATYTGSIDLATLSGRTLAAGINFYANHVNLNPTGAWTLSIHDNDNPMSAFAEAYNLSVDYCTVVDNSAVSPKFAWVSAAEGCTPGGNNVETSSASVSTGWDFTAPTITTEDQLQPTGNHTTYGSGTYTVYDDVIRVEFSEPIENSNNDIWTAVSTTTPPSAIRFNGGTLPFSGSYIDADCHTATTSQGDLRVFYLKTNAGQRWNTDATGITAGPTTSTDRGRGTTLATNRNNIPDLDIPKATTTLFQTLRDWHKNRIVNYDGPVNHVTATNTADNVFTATGDRCRPVLTLVTAAQAKHVVNPIAGPYYEWDGHNYLELTWSEPVNIGNASQLLNSSTPSDKSRNIRSTYDFTSDTAFGGDIRNDVGGFTMSGYFEAPLGPTIVRGARYQVVSTEPAIALSDDRKTANALYRYFDPSQTNPITSLSEAFQPYKLRVYLAGMAYQMPTPHPTGWVWFWPGYLDAISASPTAALVEPVANQYIRDKAGHTNSVEAYDSRTLDPADVSTTGTSIYSADAYGATDDYAKVTVKIDELATRPWDITAPEIAKYREYHSNQTGWVSPDSIYEVVPTDTQGNGFIDRFEMHIFDDAPNYDSNNVYGWASRRGWFSNNPANWGGSTIGNFPDTAGRNNVAGLVADTSIRGGIRAGTMIASHLGGTLKMESGAFKVGTTGNVSSSYNKIYDADLGTTTFGTAVTSPLFESSGAVNVLEDPYICLFTDDATLRVTDQMMLTYNENGDGVDGVNDTDIGTGYLTDLAGFRLQKTTSELACINKTPPKIALTIQPLGEKSLYLMFSKRMRIDNLNTELLINGSSTLIDSTVAPRSMQSAAETVDGYSKDAVITLTRALTLSELMSLNITPQTYSGIDPETGITTNDSLITDSQANYMSGTESHRVTDIGINVATPVYGSDGVNTDGTLAANEGALRTFDGTGRLLDRDITLSTKINSGETPLVATPDSLQLYFDVNPPASVMPKEYNDWMGASLKLWLPSILPAFNNAADVSARKLSPRTTGSSSASTNLQDIRNFILPSNDSEVKAGSQVEFILKYGDLYCARLKDPTNITSVDPWRFSISEMKLQRGGVTILNNVIDSNKRENTLLKIDMSKSGSLVIQIFTLDGNVVRTLENGKKGAGSYTYSWNGTNLAGNPVARGIYFIRVVGPDMDEIRKVMVVKE